ncbi:2-isopropylmalate synthase [Nitrosopumilus sp. b1]|uniref:cupin domain-containing protein n=1 Tax=Nitrosopumilus sp. b1 TaxID=2109907 RepID=UPI0015F52823|nr:2-isopropylmalate synthase [Nitrosopumilus sp. b1]KAF6243966.1 2-isopropylmalate synthase [Nitrosopumilus sp. b1]
MKKYQNLIKKGINESLEKIPFHKKAPIKRLSMLSKSIIPESNTHIAVHFVDASKKLPEYSQLHKHNHDEINLILSESSKLKYQIQIEDESYTVTSPSTIFIPKGLRHSAQAISGKGIFVCVILSDKYSSQ